MTREQALRLACLTREARLECLDAKARAYLRPENFVEAVQLGGNEGVATQIAYVLSNMGNWRGETARRVKTELRSLQRELEVQP